MRLAELGRTDLDGGDATGEITAGPRERETTKVGFTCCRERGTVGQPVSGKRNIYLYIFIKRERERERERATLGGKILIQRISRKEKENAMSS
jgi:hypothetical protein